MIDAPSDRPTKGMTGGMKSETRHPTQQELQALVDGELDESRATAVQQHCLDCTDCRQLRDEFLAVYEMLDAAPSPEPLRPMWPQVRQRLHPEPTPRFGLSFALGTSALTAAGIVLGIFLGSLGTRSYDSQQQDIWSALGSSIMVETDATLFDTYMSDTDTGTTGG